jgi:hypothetical protein
VTAFIHMTPADDLRYRDIQTQAALGEAQAISAAGDWPSFGTLDELRAAVDRALREARRVTSIEYRWVRRFDLAVRPDWPDRYAQQVARLRARRERAREIAEDRERLLMRLLAETAGNG